jgi:hypothetical protein
VLADGHTGPPPADTLGSVGEWESWTGMVFPEPGAYVFPHGLAPLAVDTERGVYWEPNVWMIHPDL